MRNSSFDQAFIRRAQAGRRSAGQQGRPPRSPSASVYVLAAGATAASLFFTLWWMLHSGGDEAPWVPAGLAASVVMLVAVAAREVVLQRARTRRLLERRDQSKAGSMHRSGAVSSSSGQRVRQADAYAAQLRSLQKQCAQADAAGSLPEAHLDAYLACRDYLENADETLRSSSVGSEARATLRAGQERARSLAKHHLLDWASGSSRSLTHEAQRRVRMSDKVETAGRALDVISSALRLYPDEPGLLESEAAVREFIASVRVSHWVELAERAAFKGHYSRAIDRYRDALFYLSREPVTEERRSEMAGRIEREIALLRARLKTRKMGHDPTRKED